MSPPAPDHTPSSSPRRVLLTRTVPSTIAEVFSPPIPRWWGSTPVGAEVGCGTSVRCISRRLAFANQDLRGGSLKLGTTLIASCTLMSAACENTKTCLSRCQVEPGTAVALDWVATWPCLLKLSSFGTPQPHGVGPPNVSACVRSVTQLTMSLTTSGVSRLRRRLINTALSSCGGGDSVPGGKRRCVVSVQGLRHVKLAECLIRLPRLVQLVAAWSGIQIDVLLSNAWRGQHIHLALGDPQDFSLPTSCMKYLSVTSR